ncbi:MAG: hypothetical protein Kow0025_04730 [Thermodesulfovibrionales bacterium]
MKRLILFTVLALALAFSQALAAEEFGVYVRAAEDIGMTFDEAVSALEAALPQAGWRVLASYPAGVPEGCRFRAHNIVIHSDEYAAKIMAHGPLSAFALPLRVGLYQDEKGLAAAFVNPASINRTVLGDGVEKELSAQTMDALAGAIAGALKVKGVKKQIGEVRTAGRVGGMGGGDFTDKVEVIHEGGDFEAVSAKVKEGILANRDGWTLAYSLPLAGSEAVIYGVTRTSTEARAFDIAGERRESKANSCPGIDHAPAFPIEVVVLKDSGGVKAVTLDEMYRMKLYFEDAGNWAFFKNMGMPGELEEEIKRMSGWKLR